MGILLGEPSGGLVDQDRDCDEAATVAPFFVNDGTLKGGRHGSHRNHALYVVDDPPAKASTKYATPAMTLPSGIVGGDTIIELRSTGGQTVVYGEHPTGGRYLWPEDPSRDQIARMDVAELQARTLDAAVAAILLRYYPSEGSRHDYTLAAAGYLLPRFDNDEARVGRIIEVSAACAADDEADKRLANVATTLARLEAGEPTTGAPKLAEIAPDVPFVLGRWLPQSPQKRGNKPTDDELRDRWLGRNPHYAFGQGEWKRYEGGIYAPVDAETVLNAVEAVLVDAKPEGIRRYSVTLNPLIHS